MPKPIQFQDLGTVMDDLHALFERWERTEAFLPPLDLFSRDVMKFAIHEWVANLVQHADFGPCPPLIQLRLRRNGEYVHCVIEDNSQGFDFDLQLAHQQQVITSTAPPDRGRGLLMMIACTEGLCYHQPPAPAAADMRHRLEFSISASKRPWIDIPF